MVAPTMACTTQSFSQHSTFLFSLASDYGVMELSYLHGVERLSFVPHTLLSLAPSTLLFVPTLLDWARQRKRTHARTFKGEVARKGTGDKRWKSCISMSYNQSGIRLVNTIS